MNDENPVGHNITAKRADWHFGGETANTFVDHVRQSVPFYDAGHDLVCQLSDFFVPRHGICYELGTSTGQLLRKLVEYNQHKPGIRWIGIDQEEGMIARAREHCHDLSGVELVADNIGTFDYEPCHMIVSYYTIQFVPPRLRQDLFDKIYDSLHWGGALIMFEKVRAPDARFQDIATSLYYDYKSAQGFSDHEIMTKIRSLRGVLEPFTTRANMGFMERAGFVDIMPIMKYVCFEGFVAIK